MFHLDYKTDEWAQLEVVEARPDGSYVVKDVSPYTEALEGRVRISKEIVELLSPRIDEQIKGALTMSLAERNRIKALVEIKSAIEKAPERVEIKGGKKHCLWIEVEGKEFSL